MAFDALMKNARAQVGKGRFDRSPAGAASGGQTARGRHSYWYERAAKANKGNLSAR